VYEICVYVCEVYVYIGVCICRCVYICVRCRYDPREVCVCVYVIVDLRLSLCV